ncbi:helix-turn-helix domain-containing protein [Streptomyces albidoflavus]
MATTNSNAHKQGLTASQAAKFLGVSEYTVKQWTRAKKLRPLADDLKETGGRYLFAQEELERVHLAAGSSRRKSGDMPGQARFEGAPEGEGEAVAFWRKAAETAQAQVVATRKELARSEEERRVALRMVDAALGRT